MSLQLLTNNDKLVKPYVPTDNTHKTTQLHFKKFIILMLFNWYFLHHQKRYIPHLKMKTVWNKDVNFRMVITLPLNFKWKLFPCEFSKLFLVVFKRSGTSDMKKIFFSGAYLFTVQYCLPLFSSSRPLIRKNLLLGAAPSHTQLRTLKPVLSNSLAASHAAGNNWSPVKPADTWYPSVHSKLLNIPRIINTFTYLANFLLKYSLLLSSSFTLYWSSCISSLMSPISVNPTTFPEDLWDTKPETITKLTR